MSNPSIPQCSPLASYLAQAADINTAIAETLRAGRYILGPAVTSFEHAFADWVGVTSCLGVANGTDAIEIALRASEIGPGDIVVTTSMSAVATVAAIRRSGAVPLFADVDENYGLIDAASVEELCSRHEYRVRAIVPVHLYGRCADMEAIMEIAQRHSVVVIEDCAQAHGATFEGRKAGTFGDAGCFSFYPTKNLGAMGDGGAIVTNHASLRERARLLREYGWVNRYISDIEGGNSRLDELQAAILSVKLRNLDADNDARRSIAAVYREGIRHRDVSIPPASDEGHVYHQYAVRTDFRDSLQKHLASLGVGSLVHYPAAIHEQPAYSSPTYAPLPLPRTERWSATTLSLPMFPQLSTSDALRVVQAVNSWESPA